MTSPQFVIFPLFITFVFAGLVAVAYAYRRRAQVHKRVMMLAMVTLLGPPVARIVAGMGLQAHFLAIQTGVAAAFVIACLVADWLRSRTLHPIYAFGGTLLVVSWPLRAWLARTPEWESVGSWLATLT